MTKQRDPHTERRLGLQVLATNFLTVFFHIINVLPVPPLVTYLPYHDLFLWWCFCAYYFNLFAAVIMLLRLCTADRSRFILSVKSLTEFNDKGNSIILIYCIAVKVLKQFVV